MNSMIHVTILCLEKGEHWGVKQLEAAGLPHFTDLFIIGCRYNLTHAI